MSFLGVHPRKDIINPRVVQSSYPLTSHGTTIMCGLSCGVLREAPGEGMSVLCVVCPLLYSEKSPRVRLVCLNVVCLLVYLRQAPGDGMSV